MKHFKISIVFFLTLVSALNSNCQGLKVVLNALNEKKVGKTISDKFKQNVSQATYLGTIQGEMGRVRFHIVKEFYKVKAAIVYHGHSRILFFNSSNHLVAQTIFDMPNELPYKIINNVLYFKTSDPTLSNFKNIYITDTLPKEINGYFVQIEK